MKRVLLLYSLTSFLFLPAQSLTNSTNTKSISTNANTKSISTNQNIENKNVINQTNTQNIANEKVRTISKKKEVLKKDKEKIKIVKSRKIKIDNRNFIAEISYLTKSIQKSLFKKLKTKKYRELNTDVTILSFDSTPNLKYAHQNTVISKLLLIHQKDGFSFIESFETLNFSTAIKDGKIIVTKGVQSKEELYKALNKYGSKYYATILLELRKKKYLYLHVHFIEAKTSKSVLTLTSSVRVGRKNDNTFFANIGQDYSLTNLGGDSSVTPINVSLSFGQRLYGVGEISLFPRIGSHLNFDLAGLEVLQRVYLDIGALMLFNLNEIFLIKYKNVTYLLGAAVAIRLDLILNGIFNFDGNLYYYINASFLIENLLISVEFSPETISGSPLDRIGVYIGFYL